MRRNLPGWERGLRLCTGIASIALGVVLFPGTWMNYVFACVGVVLIGTAAFAFCPACAVVGRRDAKAR